MIKLIIPIPYYVYGGVERVIIALITQFSQQVTQVIIVGSPATINYFAPKLPQSNQIIYENFGWGDIKEMKRLRLIGFFNKILKINRRLKLPGVDANINKIINKINYNDKLNYLVDKYQATHCLYMLANKISVPELKIPIATIVHDLYWNSSPLSYPQDYINTYNRSLLAWLKKSQVVFTVSEKTRQEIMSIFPGFDTKIKTVLNSGYWEIDPDSYQVNQIPENQEFIFYFPSSFGLFKDHLTLFQAIVKLAKKQLKFKIILTGKETDKLTQGDFSLSKQQQSQEYSEYIFKFKLLYQENKQIITQYCQGIGYCSFQEVEECFKQSCCVIIPSVYEGFGLGLSEAVTRGLPVIASDLDVFYEQVAMYQCSDRVWFFPKQDADTLAELMETMINQPLSKLSFTEIKQRFSHWQWQQVAQEYIKILTNFN